MYIVTLYTKLIHLDTSPYTLANTHLQGRIGVNVRGKLGEHHLVHLLAVPDGRETVKLAFGLCLVLQRAGAGQGFCFHRCSYG